MFEATSFESICQSASEFLVLFDRDGRHLACNSAYLEAVGRTSEQVSGKTAEEILGREAADFLVRRGAAEVRAGKQSRHVCCVDLPRTGTTRLEVICTAAPSAMGDSTFLLSAREHHPRDDLEASEALLVTSAHMAKVGGWQLEAESLDLRWTEETYRILGAPVEEGPRLEDGMNFFYPEDRPVLSAALERALAEGVPFDLEQRILAPDGQTRWTRSICKPLVVEGKTVRLNGTFQDISDRKMLEERAQELEAQVQRAERLESIGRLAAGVAHDFNNLLTIVLGAAEQLSPASEEDQAARERIVNASLQGARLTRQLLAMGQRSIVEPKSVELGAAIDEALVLLGRVIGEDMEIVAEPREAPLWALVDPSQLQQVIVNLVINARDAQPGGGRISLGAGLEEGVSPTGEPTTFAVLSVRDWGHGIDPEIQARIFDPFFTTKTGAAGLGVGSGLGLTVVQSIVKSSSGEVLLESEVGVGTTVKICLPQGQPVEEAQEPPPQTEVVAACSARVLLLEDEPLVRDLLRQILESAGYQVVAAGRPSEALAAWEEAEEPFSLLVTDVVMPEMRGDEVARRLRVREPKLKVLFVSGYAISDADFNETLSPEGVRYLQKPFRFAQVLDELKALCRS
jgi:two-component system, cell cycle sensor histidine kinase and response regulator CckA